MLWIDASASHTLPPADVPGVDPTSYGIASARLDALFARGYLSASGLLGSAVAGENGRWTRAELAGATGLRLGEYALRGQASVFQLHYLDPFAYDAWGLDLRPSGAAALGPFTLTARPLLTVGGWSTDLLEGGLLVAGGEAEVQRQLGPVRAAVTATATHVDNGLTVGAFVRGEADASVTRGRWSAGVRVRVQQTPLETEAGWGVRVLGALRPGLLLHLDGGRTVRDPLFGTQGTTSVSAGMTVRPVRWAPPQPAPVAAVGSREDGGRRVRFSLRAPGAERVELTGDFTGWEPVAMTRTAAGWQVERVLPPGLHHFGFLVDGLWSIPPDAPGVVEDGWGRENASLVVEP